MSSASTHRSVLIVATATLLALTVSILLAGTTRLDHTVRDTVLQAATPAWIEAFRVFNVAGEWTFLLPATLLLIGACDQARRTWWIWIALMMAAPLMEWALKEFVARPRPEDRSFGFPSGHATAIAAYTGAVLAVMTTATWRVRTAAALAVLGLMLLVGLARIVLRAHWPSDVAAGFALGLALASLAAMLASRREAAGT